MRGYCGVSGEWREMNKVEVAETLGCSTRQVEKYASENRLGVVYVRGKRGNVASYQPEEVARLQDELARERQEVVGHAAPHVALATQRGSQSQAGVALVEQLTSGLERQHADADRIIAALEALKVEAAPQVALANKLTLSLAEAAALSGLSRGHLREAIAEKKLKARIIGRGWRIKRDDLDAYIKKL
jgi:excisionase family DNA binding protein